MVGFTGTLNDGIINVAGFGGLDREDGSVELAVTNFRPSIDHATGQIHLDQAAVGGNSTIEIFQTRPGSDGLEFVRTHFDPLISTPNRAAIIQGKGFYISNDHGHHKPGLVSFSTPGLRVGLVPRTWCFKDPSLT